MSQADIDAYIREVLETEEVLRDLAAIMAEHEIPFDIWRKEDREQDEFSPF